MSFPALDAFAEDPLSENHTVWRVYMHLQRTLLSHTEPRPVKVRALTQVLRVGPASAIAALNQLVERGYIIEHSAGSRGVRNLSLAWSVRDNSPKAQAIEAAMRDSWKITGSQRRARKRAAGGQFTKADLRRQYIVQGGRCYYCDAALGTNYHAEHKTPLCRGGSNGPENIVCSCGGCNMRKGSLTAEEFFERYPKSA